MSDPTVIVLSGVFLAALGLCLLPALFRISARRIRLHGGKSTAKVTGRLESDHEGDGDEWPMELALPPRLPRGKVPVWFYRWFDLLGVAFVFWVFGGLALSASQAPQLPTPVLSPPVLMVTIAFQFILAGAVTMFVIWRVSPVLWLGLHWPSRVRVLLIAPGIVLFMWLLFWGLQASGYMQWMESFGVDTVQDTVKVLQKSGDPLLLSLMSVAAIIVAPICEEIVFRGYFYPAMKKFAGVWPAAMASAMVFGAAHGNLTALLPLFVFGLLLVWVYETTGSLWAPVAVHFCFNGTNVLLLLVARYFNIPLDPVP